jgi:hypothetical protein
MENLAIHIRIVVVEKKDLTTKLKVSSYSSISDYIFKRESKAKVSDIEIQNTEIKEGKISEAVRKLINEKIIGQ